MRLSLWALVVLTQGQEDWLIGNYTEHCCWLSINNKALIKGPQCCGCVRGGETLPHIFCHVRCSDCTKPTTLASTSRSLDSEVNGTRCSWNEPTCSFCVDFTDNRQTCVLALLQSWPLSKVSTCLCCFRRWVASVFQIAAQLGLVPTGSDWFGSRGYCKHPWLEAGARLWGFQSDVCSSQLLVPSPPSPPPPPPPPRNMEDASNVFTMIFKVVVHKRNATLI